MKKQTGKTTRRTTALIMALMLSMSGTSAAYASGTKMLTDAPGARVYTSANEHSELLLTLNRGDEFTLLELDKEWCMLELGDITGYALIEELGIEVDKLDGSSVISEGSDEAEPTQTPEAASSPKITDAPADEQTAAPEATDAPSDEQTAAPEATDAPAAEQTAAPEATDAPAAEQTAAPQTTAVIDDGEPDADEIDALYAATKEGTDKYGIVNASMLNIRAGASASSAVVTKLARGTTVKILGTEGNYYLISYGTRTGYAASQYIVQVDNVNQTSGTPVWGSAIVTASTLNVRAKDSTSSAALYKLSKGDRVLLNAYTGDWYYIETKSGAGYVLGDYLDKSVISGTKYQSGSSGAEVKEIQRRLIELGYLSGSADGSFGASTKSAVAAFQKASGLSSDGVVGTSTLNKLFSVSAPENGGETYSTLQYGDSGAAVTALQNRLRELGYLTASATGNFGSATKTALIEFQKAAGLTADGVASVSTQQALYAANAPAKGNGSITSTTLKLGDKGDDVKTLQTRLIELGYLTTSATGTFGEATKAAVQAFQTQAGLTADGVAGSTTLKALFAADAPSNGTTGTLKPGDSGAAVKTLQSRLIELGYLKGTADGSYGAGTKAAVMDFQKQVGITADGIAGSATITALFSANAPRKDDGTLRLGDKGDAVISLQKRLRQLGYLTDEVDGIFGDTTDTAVKEFQKAIGVSADGIVGATTLAKLNASDAPEKAGVILRLGDSGDAVKGLQKRLIELGYLTGTADGKFGAATKSALMEFQTAAGLSATGVADVDTQETLEASDAPEKNGTTLKQGDSGEAVKKLQTRLIELGYLTGTADGTFGATTKTAVAAFQSAAGLTADGVAGPATQAAIYADDAPSASSPDATTLQMGSTGEAVKKLQTRLIELGYLSGTADGTFGAATRAAVKLFQKEAGLTVDGIAGAGTQLALYASDAPKYDGDTTVDTDTSSTAEKMISTAKQYLGCAYVYGTSGPNTFDCSGFTQFVFKKYGYTLLRSALQQGYNDNYTKLTRSQLKMGDLVFFNTISDNDLSDHVGIYISNGDFIHASSGKGVVTISNLDSGYYNRVFSWGRRILS